MHNGERIESCSQVIHHYTGTLGKLFQSPNWKRLPNIEDTEEYKAREKGFLSERDGDECNQLPGYFINKDEFRFFQARRAHDLGRSGNSDECYSVRPLRRRPALDTVR